MRGGGPPEEPAVFFLFEAIVFLGANVGRPIIYLLASVYSGFVHWHCGFGSAGGRPDYDYSSGDTAFRTFSRKKKKDCKFYLFP